MTQGREKQMLAWENHSPCLPDTCEVKEHGVCLPGASWPGRSEAQNQSRPCVLLPSSLEGLQALSPTPLALENSATYPKEILPRDC